MPDPSAVPSRPPASTPRPDRRILASGLLFGVGLAATVDEVVFHQLLRWHHFYDRSTTAAGLVSDGIFHAFGWFAVVASLFLLAETRRAPGWSWIRWLAGVAIGTGGFQAYDGVVQHKLLRLHQIRYEVDLWAYDLIWLIVAAVLIIAGIAVLAVRRRDRPSRAARPESSAGA